MPLLFILALQQKGTKLLKSIRLNQTESHKKGTEAMPGSQRTTHKAQILLEIITEHCVVPGSSTDSPGFDVSGIVCKCSAWAVRDGMLPAGCTGRGLLSLASHQGSATAWDFKCPWVSVGSTLRWATLSGALEAGKFYLQPLGGKPPEGSCWMERTWGKEKEQHGGAAEGLWREKLGFCPWVIQKL